MDKNITRRDFLKIGGAGALAIGAAAACGPKKTAVSALQTGDGEMEYRINPNSGDKVSLLGYGCMRWPMIKDADGKDIVDQEKVDELIDYAIAHGVNYFDSAPVYLQGQSEAATGKSLSRYPRESYYVATKLSNTRGFEPTLEEGIEMYHKSLEYFRTDYLDYFLLHNIGSGAVFERRFVRNGLIDFLVKEREAGRIKNLGFSFHGQAQGFDELLALHDKYHWDFIQIQMNYVDWTHADPRRNTNAEYLYKRLDELQIPITIMEPLLGGQLSSVPMNVMTKFKERDPNASVASWAFRFVGSYPRVLSVLSGMTYMEHLVDNCKTFNGFHPMDDDEKAFMEEMAVLMREYPTIPCTNCKYCMPCPYGIDIPTIFAHYNQQINDGSVPQNSAQKDYRRLRKQFLTTYDKAVPTLRQADHCIGCGQCQEKCPQSIRIPNELQRIDRYIEQLKQDTL